MGFCVARWWGNHSQFRLQQIGEGVGAGSCRDYCMLDMHISSLGLIFMNNMIQFIASHGLNSPSVLTLLTLHCCLGPLASSPLLTLHRLDGPSCPKLLACPSLSHMGLPWSSPSCHMRLRPGLDLTSFCQFLRICLLGWDPKGQFLLPVFTRLLKARKLLISSFC